MDKLIVGCDLKTFPEVFMQHRTPYVYLTFDRGHSDYLGLAMAACVPARLLLLFSFIHILRFIN